MSPREIDAKEVVRWLEELEARTSRWRWIAGFSLLVALGALLLPALPRRYSPWPRHHVDALEFAGVAKPSTGHFYLGVKEGADPRVSLASSSFFSHANLEIQRGTPSLDLYDETGQQARLQLAPRGAWSPGAGTEPPDPFYGFDARGRGGQIKLGGEDRLVKCDLRGGSYGSVRLWSGHRPLKWHSPLEPPRPDLEERAPGSGLVLLDAEDRPRVAVLLTGPQEEPKEDDPDDERRNEAAPTPPDPVPAVTLFDAQGKERVHIRLDPVVLERGEKPPPDQAGVMPGLVLLDHHARERVIIRLDEDGAPMIRLLDAEGRVIWRAP